MVNTIENASYNFKMRTQLYRVFAELQTERDKLAAEVYDIENDAEFDEREHEVLEMSERIEKAYMACFAAQFHCCRNEWFAKVVDSLPSGEWQRITEKQYYCFERYASDIDSNHWRDGKRYCRVGDYLVTLVRHNSLRAIKKEFVTNH